MLADYDTARQMERTHVCTVCKHKAIPVCRWNAKEQSYEVVCGGCSTDEHLVRRESVTAQWRRNPDSVPVHTANVLEAKYGGRPLATTELAKMDEKSLVQRMEGAKWLTQMAPQDKTALAQLSIQYGLDPLMGELTIYEGKPYISVNGMVRVAHENPLFEGLEDRPMTSEEKQSYGITQRIGWIAKVYRKGWRVPVVGTGAADPEKPFRNNPVERERPQWMARARAIRQALRLAFPAAVPFKLPYQEERGAFEAEIAGDFIDQETGEIVDPRLTAKVVVDGRVIEGQIGEIEGEPGESVRLGGFLDDEPELSFDDSDLPEPTAEEAGDAQSDLFAEARRAELLEGLHQKVDTKRDGWKRLTNYFELQYGCPPEQGTAAQLEAAYQYVTGGK